MRLLLLLSKYKLSKFSNYGEYLENHSLEVHIILYKLTLKLVGEFENVIIYGGVPFKILKYLLIASEGNVLYNRE